MTAQLKLLVQTTRDAYDTLPVDENITAVERLKEEHGALVLCHTYQRPEVHKVADYVGDSYGLSVLATKTTKPLIVFCGVHFMAETAKILNPDKKVLLPSLEAGCGLADNITAKQLHVWKEAHPGIPVVLYINSSAACKAEADIICTSANTLKAIEAAEGDTVLLAPDKNLYYNAQPKTKKTLLPWEGYCPIHKAMTRDLLEYAIMEHPEAEIVAHPECNPDVTSIASAVLSTSAMADHVRKSLNKEFIIVTEQGLIDMLQGMFPDKKFYNVAHQTKSCDETCVCPYMKTITIGKVRRALEKDIHEITVPEDTRIKALSALEKMIRLGRDK